MHLSSAYYLLHLAAIGQKYLMFQFEEFWCKYVCLKNNLSYAPRILTKLMKTMLTSLRKIGKPSNEFFG